MRMLIAAAAVAAAMPALAQAQTTSAAQDASGAVTTAPGTSAAPAPDSAPATAGVAGPSGDAVATATQVSDSSSTNPDGTPTRRIEPYVAITGGYEWFDRQENRSGVPANGPRFDGEIVKGAVGINVPLNFFFVGIEGTLAKGFRDLDWQYGVAGRVGIRPGNTGMIYARGGYQWVQFRRNVPDTGHSYKDWTWGLGVEVGPKTLGLGNMPNLRLRGEVNTFGSFHSFQPTAGLVLAF